MHFIVLAKQAFVFKGCVLLCYVTGENGGMKFVLQISDCSVEFYEHQIGLGHVM